MTIAPLDLSRLKVLPLTERQSLTRADDILVDPNAAPPALASANATPVQLAAERIRAARERGASVLLIYGAHLLRNGAARLLDSLMAGGWITHLATNGAGTGAWRATTSTVLADVSPPPPYNMCHAVRNVRGNAAAEMKSM